MLRSLSRVIRRASTSAKEYQEHYQYLGNPAKEEYDAWYAKQYHREYLQDNQVFKPKEQIEFDRVGELLLYECDTYRVNPVYMPYPHALGTLWVPFSLYLYLENPFELLWNTQSMVLFSSLFALYPMTEYLWRLRFHINRLFLLRGGTVLKVEHSSVTGQRWITWIFIDEINLLSKDKLVKLPDRGASTKVVGDDGGLLDDTFIQVNNFVDIGRNINNCVLTLNKNAKVHQPEILNAVLRGFEVDTSNFRINTLHTERWFEPGHNI